MGTAHFSDDLFKFLSGLKKNNSKVWFEKNRKVFEAELKGAAMKFIADMQIPMEVMAPRIKVDPRPSGGSLFRIYRDVRFSKDKSPYKTHVGIQFRHVAGKDAHAPGFYLHLEPGEVFTAGGVWHPDGKTLHGMRLAIAENPDEWKKLTRTAAFRKRFELWGEKLKRPPKGFDAEHPLAEDLKMKEFMAIEAFTQKQALSPNFLPQVVKSFEAMNPLMKFLSRGAGYLW